MRYSPGGWGGRPFLGYYVTKKSPSRCQARLCEVDRITAGLSLRVRTSTPRGTADELGALTLCCRFEARQAIVPRLDDAHGAARNSSFESVLGWNG